MGNRLLANAKTFRAIAMKNYNDEISVMEMSFPEKIDPDHVVVQVKYSGLNYIDILVHRGWFKNVFFPKFPYVFGTEGSGIVVAVGCNCSDFKVGDQVLGLNGNGGTCAEYAIFKEKELVKKPSNMSYELAASIPTSGMIAYECLLNIGNLKENQKILVLGGSGAVGSTVIQLAKSLGVEVYATTSSPNIDFVKKCGANHVIDYKKYSFDEFVDGDLDMVIDCVGETDSPKRTRKLIKNRGKFVKVAINEEIGYLSLVQVGSSIVKNYFKWILGHPTYHIATYRPNQKNLQELVNLYASGQMKSTISKIYKFDDYKLAYSLLESRKSTGKVLLKVGE